jgi:predicted O-methyltransferase YrrM
MLNFELCKEFKLIEAVIVDKDWEIFGNNPEIPVKDYYNFYYSYAQSWKPKSVLEIGVRLGYSAIALVSGAGEALEKYIGIDAEIDILDSLELTKTVLSEHTEAQIRLIKCNTQNDDLPTDLGRFDLIHIDADHSFNGCLNDLLWSLSLADVGTRIIIDDNLYAPVRSAVELVAKMYASHIKIKYITNWRGHALIEVITPLTELSSQASRKEIVTQQYNSFTGVNFNTLLAQYLETKISLETQFSELPSLSDITGSLDKVKHFLEQLNQYLTTSIDRLDRTLDNYRQSGFQISSLTEVIEKIQNNLRNNQVNQTKFSKWSLHDLKRKNVDKNKHESEYSKTCKKAYKTIFLLAQLSDALTNSSVAKCFNYFIGESGKHLQYLNNKLNRLESQISVEFESISAFLNDLIDRTDGYRTKEGHLLILLILDALVNISSCFHLEIECQFWMQNWQIENNLTWKTLIVPSSEPDSIPHPFPVKTKVEYDEFYQLQKIDTAGGAKIVDRNNKIKEGLKANPTDQAFRLATTISHIELILELLKERHPEETIRWLDIGCGIGYVANKVEFDGTVIGIDVAESLISYANQTKRTTNHKYIKGNIADAVTAIAGEKFHLITATEFIENLWDPLSFIKDISEYTCDLIYASSPLNEIVPTQPSREHLWSFSLPSYTRLFTTVGMQIIFTSTIEVGKHSSEGNNWLSVVATHQKPFRVFPP